MQQRKRRSRLWVSAGALLALVFGVSSALADASLTDAGRRIYRDGILSSGQLLHATVEHDVALSGARAACVNCHRRSGYGASEGNRVVPPITATYLFRDKQVQNQDLLGTRASPGVPYARPAYDDGSLRRALREGLHVSGAPLNALMPRYVLAEPDIELLIGYLRTLSAVPPPGVTDTEMHFATLVTEDVSERQRQALLGVMESFFRDKNAETRRETIRREQRTVMGHGRVYRAYHKWRLHVWALQGASSTWPQQIDRYYQQQPVYAVLGGVGHGSWQEIQMSCERLELPCLFPNTDRPVVPDGEFFSLYFTRGVVQEAEVLAQSLMSRPTAGPRRLLQVYRQQDSGELAAAALRRALAGTTGFDLEDRVLTDDTAGSAGFWDTLLAEKHASVVLWLRDKDLAHWPRGASPGSAPIYLSDSLLEDPARVVPAGLRSRIRVVLLRELPAIWQDRRARVTSWLTSHKLALTDERIQANTHMVLSLVTRAITHMRENISREYLVERIEHLVQTGSWPSIYPRLSLGPGQRVASQGGYVVPLREDGSLPVNAEWIVPGTSVPE